MLSLDRAFRRHGTPFRLYAQSPVLEGFAEPETVWLSTPRALVGPGPSDHRMFVIRPVGKKPYDADDLPPWRGGVEAPVLPGRDGTFGHLGTDDPGFLAVHMFGAVRRVLDVWECYLGGPVAWPFAAAFRRLELIPHVPWNNAQFGWGYMECGEGADDQGVQRPFALNFDVLAHETGHGLLYALVGVPGPAALTAGVRGFHESAADCVAMLAAMHFESVLAEVLKDTAGSLYVANELNRIGELSHTRQIRSASNAATMAHVVREDMPAAEVTGKQMHALGLPLTGAIFDVLVEFFLDRLVAGGVIPRRDADGLRRAAAEGAEDTPAEARCKTAYRAHPDRCRDALAEARDMTGLRLAAAWRHLAPDGLTFARFAAAFLAADRAMTGGRHTEMIRKCFAWRGIAADSEMAPRSLCVV
jgi:Fungalysin metallopeptidase (M36)